MFEELKALFEQFKAANDERLKQIEAKGHADPLLESKVDRINAALGEKETEISAMKAQLDAAEAKINRFGGGNGQTEEEAALAEHKAAFKAYFQKGNRAAMDAYEIKGAMSDGSDPDGGYAIPPDLDRNIGATLVNMSAMRRLSNVITRGIGYYKLYNVHGTASGWVGETDPRPTTGTPSLKKIVPYFGQFYANPATTQDALDDLFFDVESFLNQEVTTEIEKQESVFVNGNGINKPKGILAFPTATTSDATRAFGTIETIKSGDASAFAAVTATASPFDKLIDITSAMKPGHRNGASWLMNKATLGYFRKLKSTLEGEYLMTLPTLAAPGTILGYSYDEDENMPDIAAGALPILFGNLKRAYTIVDVMGTRVIRDNLTNKPYVSFYTTKRTGSMLEDSEAVKFLLIGA